MSGFEVEVAGGGEYATRGFSGNRLLQKWIRTSRWNGGGVVGIGIGRVLDSLWNFIRKESFGERKVFLDAGGGGRRERCGGYLV